MGDAIDTTDLFIEVTPCNGRVEMYLSTEYNTLFSNQTRIEFQDTDASMNFGIYTGRIRNVSDFEVIYIGIESSNLFFKSFKGLTESIFEITTRLIPSSQADLTQTYALVQNNKVIDIVPDKDKEGNFLVIWNKIYERSKLSSSSFVPVEDVSYMMFAGKTQDTAYQMNSLCALHYANQSSLFSIFLNPEDMKQNRISLSSEDLDEIKVIGIIARVKDPLSGEIVSLSYEPFTFSSVSFGVKVNNT